MKFIKSAGWSMLATLSNVGASVISGKLFSVYFGPPGLALQSLIQNLVSIITSIPNEGINRGLIKYLSGKPIQNQESQVYLFSSLALHLVAFVVSVPAVILLFRASSEIPSYLSSNNYLLIFCVAAASHICILILFSLLLSALHVQAYALFSVLNNVIGCALIYAGITKSLYAAAIMLVISPSAALIFLCAFVIFRFRRQVTQLQFKITYKAVQDLFQFLLIAVSILVFGKLIDFFVRVYIIDQYDLYQTGLWQSAVKISDGYSTLFNGVYGAVFFPKLAAVINNREDVKQYLRQAGMVTLWVVPLFLLGVFVLKRLLLVALFEKSFEEAAYFMDYQIIGDVFKFYSWFLVYIILAEAKTGMYILLQFLSAVGYIGLLILFCKTFGIVGATYAHAVRYVLFFGATFFIFRRYLF